MSSGPGRTGAAESLADVLCAGGGGSSTTPDSTRWRLRQQVALDHSRDKYTYDRFDEDTPSVTASVRASCANASARSAHLGTVGVGHSFGRLTSRRGCILIQI
eukprot:scaffold5855_cov117-Isochrysis_galbana.AAC.1